MARRSLLEADLAGLERSIYELEEAYLDDTAHYGNVVKGWEGFINSKVNTHKAHHHHHSHHPTAGGPLPGALDGGGGAGSASVGGGPRRSRIGRSERLFSSSSATAPSSIHSLPSQSQPSPALLQGQGMGGDDGGGRSAAAGGGQAVGLSSSSSSLLSLSSHPNPRPPYSSTSSPSLTASTRRSSSHLLT